MDQKFCLFSQCGNPVRNWRTNYCCRLHQRSHAGMIGGLRAKGQIVTNPKRTKEEIATYHRQWAIEKQNRTKKATPIWANNESIKKVYQQAVALTESTGIRHEVDHIVPLTNKLVCGLHVEHNLRVVTFAENRTKSNKFDINDDYCKNNSDCAGSTALKCDNSTPMAASSCLMAMGNVSQSLQVTGQSSPLTEL